MNFDYSLYLVTDRSFLKNRSLEETVLAAVAGGVSIVQLREKEVSSSEFFEIARRLKTVLEARKIPLIINDRLDIALAVGASGVHLGESDLPVAEARRIMGKDIAIGLSVGDEGRAREARALGANYVGVGPAFPTMTKLDAGEALGVERVRAICQSTSLPVVAIGGISVQNVKQLSGLGLAGVAVVSAIMGAEDPREAARDLRSLFKGER